MNDEGPKPAEAKTGNPYFDMAEHDRFMREFDREQAALDNPIAASLGEQGPLVEGAMAVAGAAYGLGQGIVGLVDAVTPGELVADEDESFEGRPDIFKPQTVAGRVGSSILQFMLPFGALGKAGKLATAAGTAGRAPAWFGRYVVGSGLTSAVAFSGQDGNLSSWLRDDLGLTDPVTGLLATNPEDPELLNRGRLFLEDMVVGGPLGVVTDLIVGPAIMGARALRNGRSFSEGFSESFERTLKDIHPADAAKAGLIPPEVSEELGGTLPSLDSIPTDALAGPERAARVAEMKAALALTKSADSTVDETVENTLVPVFDRIAAVWAQAAEGRTIDQFYGEKLVSVKFDGKELAAAVESLNQGSFVDMRTILGENRELQLDDTPIQRKQRDKVPADVTKEEYAQSILSRHSVEEGWAAMSYSVEVDKDGTEFVKWKPIQYDYHTVPEEVLAKAPTGKKKEAEAAYRHTMAKRHAAVLVEEFRALQKRAAADSTDPDAAAVRYILSQATWYRGMTREMRDRFGSSGDLMIDLLGALSPQTPVRDNYLNAVQALSRYSRGEYDKQISRYVRWKEKELPKQLRAWEKENERLVAAGLPPKPASTKPKFSSAFPEFDRALKGKYYDIGGELDIAGSKIQKLRQALTYHFEPNELADKLELVRVYNPELVQQGYLQSIDQPLPPGTRLFVPNNYGINTEAAMGSMADLWLYSINSPKAGNFRQNLAGINGNATIDVWAARTLQRIADQIRAEEGRPVLGRIPPKAEKTVGGSISGSKNVRRAEYLAGDEFATGAFGYGQQVFDLAAADLGMSPDDLQAVIWFSEKERWARNGWSNEEGARGSFEEWTRLVNPRRHVVGFTTATDTFTPTAAQLRRTADRLKKAVLKQEGVISVVADVSYGRFKNTKEPNLNFEVVGTDRFDPDSLLRLFAAEGQKAGQRSVFVSRVLTPGEVVEGSRPQLEIVFDKTLSPEVFDDISEELARSLPGGFTVMTDPRNGQPIGFRQQFIPEYTGVAARHTKAAEEAAEDAFYDAISTLAKKHPEHFVSGSIHRVDTIVIGEGGTPYGEFMGRSRSRTAGSRQAVGAGGSPQRARLSLRPDSSGGGGAADQAVGGSRAAFLDRREIRRRQRALQAADAGGSGGDAGGLRVPPSRHFSRLWHFSREPRAAGLSRKFAGTGKAGAERAKFRKLEDGSIDPTSAAVHAYAPGSRIESGLGEYLHALEGDGGYTLLNMEGRAAAAFWSSAKAEAAEVGGDPGVIFQREVAAAGYDGVYRPEMDDTDWKAVQLFRDIDGSEIASIDQLDGESIRALKDGRATLYQSQSPLEQYVAGEQAVAGARGQITFEDGKAFVKLFESGDASTIMHEAGHLLRRLLGDIDKDLDSKIKSAYGIDGSRSAADIAGEEAFAADFEKYLLKGEYAQESMKPVFERMKELLRSIYKSVISGFDLEGIQIKREAREVFDFVFGDSWNRFDGTGRPSSIPPLKPTPKVIDARKSYLAANGIDADALTPEYLHIDEKRAKAIADAYEAAPHSPRDPAVKQSYAAFKEQTAAQYQHLLDSGFSFRFTRKDPYSSSQAMIEDVQRHNRLFVFLTNLDDMPEGHPLAEKTGLVVDTIEGESVALTYNDLFRAVHDIFGHAGYGYQFGPRGEESAWLAHSQMYGRVARPAMTAETRGQNNWVNAGRHLRNADGSIRKAGDEGFLPASDRPFAQQKATILPDWATDPKGMPEPDTLRQSLRESILTALDRQVPLEDAIREGFNLHINYGRIQTTDDVRRVMAEIEPFAQEMADGKVGKAVTLEQIRTDAEALIGTPEAAGELVAKLQADQALYSDLAPKLVALRMLHAGTTRRVAELAHKVKAAGRLIDRDEHLREALDASIRTAVLIDELRAVVQKSAARATTSGRVVVDDGTADAVLAAIRGIDTPASKAVKEAADKAAREGLKELSDSLVGGKNGYRRTQHIADVIIAAEKTGATGTAIRKLHKASKDPTVWEAAMEVWRAGLLSGIRTFGVNFLSGGMQTAVLPAFRAVGALAAGDKAEMAKAIGMYGHLAGAAKDMIQSLIHGADSPTDAKRIFRMVADEGTKPLTASSAIEDRFAFRSSTFGISPDTPRGRATDKAGRILRTPFRVNMAFEEIWSQLNYTAFVRQKADEAVRVRVWDNPDIPDHLKPDAAKRVHDEYVREAFDENGMAASAPDGSWTHADAVRYAQTVNFTQDLLGGFSQSLGDLRANHPSLMLLLPFHKAPSNLLRDSRRMLPGLGFAQRAGELRRQAALGVTESPWERNMRNGQAVVGTAAGIFVASLAAEGFITGGGPVNPVERARLMETGWRPYSFVLTNEDGSKSYLGFNRLDPFGATIGLVADAVEVFPYLEEHRRDEIAGKIVGGIANNLGARSYLRSLHETFRAIFQAQHYGPSYIRNFASTLVPNLVGSAVVGEDENFREARTIVEAWKRRLPGLSKTLAPRRNILGEPITPNGGWLPFVSPDNPVARTASPMAFSPGTSDAVYNEFAELRLALALPSRRLAGVLDMTRFRNEAGQDAYDRLQELTGTLQQGGKTLKQRLHELFSSKSYQELPKITGNRDIDSQNPRVKAVQGLIRGYRNAARAKVLEEYPELRSAYELLIQSRAEQDLSIFELIQ